jgi:TRAP-type C4-dicarboxylate transport system permease small subunit
MEQPRIQGRAGFLAMASRLHDRIVDLFALLAILAPVVAAGLITADVGSRSFGNGSIYGAQEMVEYTVFVSAFFGAPWILRRNAHVSIDFVVDSLSPAALRVVNLLADLLGLLGTAIIAIMAVRLGIFSVEQNRLVFRTFIFPEWWLFAAAAPCMAVMSCEFARRLYRALRGQLHASSETLSI